MHSNVFIVLCWQVVFDSKRKFRVGGANFHLSPAEAFYRFGIPSNELRAMNIISDVTGGFHTHTCLIPHCYALTFFISDNATHHKLDFETACWFMAIAIKGRLHNGTGMLMLLCYCAYGCR